MELLAGFWSKIKDRTLFYNADGECHVERDVSALNYIERILPTVWFSCSPSEYIHVHFVIIHSQQSPQISSMVYRVQDHS